MQAKYTEVEDRIRRTIETLTLAVETIDRAAFASSSTTQIEKLVSEVKDGFRCSEGLAILSRQDMMTCQTAQAQLIRQAADSNTDMHRQALEANSKGHGLTHAQLKTLSDSLQRLDIPAGIRMKGQAEVVDAILVRPPSLP